ncbi:hypothetical protein SISNIDRAFT_484443 [Sistotremastrum niveocremeum HHB9708]|uniref:F-box domain-containing protein n=1 Tax=Sistotremastrum niveocremeum HHB9708 TaxID=1314777 RepID=A0A164WC77_9AGAM|nr:hypothetical protein SISNIDRAFT_484443 [Sistotremastrum niveocremeum HHB9708]
MPLTTSLTMLEPLDELCQGFHDQLETLILQARVQGVLAHPCVLFADWSQEKRYLDHINKELARCMARVNRETNFHVGIGRLPDEVLGRIMVYYLWLPKISKLRHTRSPQSWRTLCLVCTRWRTVAFNTPSLWNQISFKWTPRMIDLFFDRSGVCPLSLFAMALTDQYGDVFKKRLHKEINRISRLFIGWIPEPDENPSDAMTRFLEDQLSSEKRPALTDLYLSYGKAILSQTTSLKPPNAPNLLLLELRGISFTTAATPFPRLQVLNILNSPMTISEIFSFLKSCPSLETLYIERRRISHPSKERFLSGPSIPLPKLKTSTIRNFSNRSLSNLLSRLIDSAASAFFDLRLSRDTTNATTLIEILPETLTSLLRSASELSLDATTAHSSDSFAYLLTLNSPRIKFKISQCPLDLKSVLSGLTSIGVHKLSAITIVSKRLPEAQSLAKFFHSSPGLRKVGIQTKDPRPFFEAIESGQTTKEDTAYSPKTPNPEKAIATAELVILPLLSELNIFRTPYSRSLLKTFLNKRRIKGMKIRSLKMTYEDDDEYSDDEHADKTPLKDIKALVDVFEFVSDYPKKRNQDDSDSSTGIECECDDCLSEEDHHRYPDDDSDGCEAFGFY